MLTKVRNIVKIKHSFLIPAQPFLKNRCFTKLINKPEIIRNPEINKTSLVHRAERCLIRLHDLDFIHKPVQSLVKIPALLTVYGLYLWGLLLLCYVIYFWFMFGIFLFVYTFEKYT